MADLFQVHRERVGQRIKAARVASGMSHDRLAVRVGTSRQHLIKLEKGMHAPRPEMLAAIAREVGKPEAFFTSESDDEDESSMATSAESEFLEALRPLARLLAETR
jgi:transcriptional regulator with XRE-family HTH domain